MERYNDTQITAFKEEFDNFLTIAKEKSSAVQVRGNRDNNFSEFYPHLQFITLDALKEEDWPNNIDMNSIYLCFEIDFKNKKVQLHTNGHVYLSPKDKQENSRWKYYAMRGMVNIATEDYGVKKFRKQGFKSAEDLFNKVEKYFKAVMDAVTKYTGGYPYKQGIVPPEDEKAA